MNVSDEELPEVNQQIDTELFRSLSKQYKPQLI